MFSRIYIIAIMFLISIPAWGQTNLEFDTTILYTPIQKIEGNEIDTLHVYQNSEALRDFDEPRIYYGEFSDETDVIRLAWFKDSKPVVYRIEKNRENIQLIKKKSFSGSYFFNISDSIETKTVNITISQYRKIAEKLTKANYWVMDLETDIFPPDILIETKISSNYHFINKDNHAIQRHKKYRRLLKLFRYLDNLIKLN